MHALVSDPGGVLSTRHSVDPPQADWLPVRGDRRLSPIQAGLSNDHNYTFFGAQYTSLWYIPIYRGILDPPGFELSSQSWPADFTTDLVANL
jgi:hypothetical protein